MNQRKHRKSATTASPAAARTSPIAKQSAPTGREKLGLIAGSGALPLMYARAARERGIAVHAIALKHDGNPALATEVDSFATIELGRVDALLRHLKKHGVTKAAFAGGIGRIRATRQFRPDFGALRVLGRLKSFRDDEVLRATAAEFAAQGIEIVAPTQLLPEVLAPAGHLAGPPLSRTTADDVRLGREVAAALGRADAGQTVVIKRGTVLALEAVEGTDECIRRAARLGGRGIVVVKRSKPTQDRRFDLPTVGPVTIETLREVGATTLAFEAHATILLEPSTVLNWAERFGISVVAFE